MAQAFHWFDAPAALTEIARILRPGGTLLLVWNDRDVSVPWVAEMTRLIQAHDPGVYEDDTDWHAVIGATGLFTPPAHGQVPNVQRGVDIETVVARATSTSYVAAAGEPVVEEVARQVRAIVAGFEEPFDHPYVTQIYTCERC